jgi:hypothetical protein
MTLLTRFGKFRSQSQRRYICIGQRQDAESTRKTPWTVKRSDTAATCHKAAKGQGAFWSRDLGCYVARFSCMKSYKDPTYFDAITHYVVIDTVTGQEVPA